MSIDDPADVLGLENEAEALLQKRLVLWRRYHRAWRHRNRWTYDWQTGYQYPHEKCIWAHRLQAHVRSAVFYPRSDDSEDNIVSLGLPRFTRRALYNAGVNSLRFLRLLTDQDLRGIPGFGKKSLRAVREQVPPPVEKD